MKFIKQLTFFVILLFTTLNVFAQNKESVWAVDFVKTKPGQYENFVKFLNQGWKPSRQALKQKGLVSSFKVLTLPADEKAEWDVLLMTEYPNRQTYDKREEIFGELFKQRAFPPVTKEERDAMRTIVFSREFSSPISSEAAEMMLNSKSADSEEAAARIPLENYLQGHATGNGEFHQKAFFPESRLLWVRDGKFNQRTSAEYIKGSSGKPAADEANRKRWIEMVEVSGNAAIAKIVLDYPTNYFADYFALLKIGNEWKIVNKSFHVEPRKNPTDKITFTVNEEDKKAVGMPLENYFKAQATGNGDLIRKAFHPEAKVMFYGEDKFQQWSAEEFAGFFKGKPADDEKKRKRKFKILDITGNAAIARVNLDFPTVKYVDYMTLIKLDGEWKIINKTFYAEPKSKK